MPFHYGPLSYYRLGRCVPRDRLREPYAREPLASRFGGILIPPPDLVFRRVGCLPPPARYDEAAVYARLVDDGVSRPARGEDSVSRAAASESADSRPRRGEDSGERPSRRDECR